MPTTRGTPSGLQLEQGFKSLITMANDPTIEFFELTVQPPSADGGDPIDQTTMHNTAVRTKAFRTLIDFTDAPVTAAYDPSLYDAIIAQMNVNQLLTITYPTGATLDFFGALTKADFAALTEGELPEVTLTFVPSNIDSATGLESVPNSITAAGTD